MNRTRESFKHSNILSKIRGSFKDTLKGDVAGTGISTTDCLMSGLAIFALKYESLLQFDKERGSEKVTRYNLSSLYGVKKAPCDTYLRERLDGQELSVIRNANAKLFGLLQRSKVVELWKFLDNKYLVSLDASGFFSSSNVKCNCCCEKVLHKGSNKEETIYHHQMLVGSMVSPSMKQVFPMEFMPIIKEDGAKKNECERSCAKRWLKVFRQYHPQLPVIIVADGLYSNGPFIKELASHRCSYILVAKEDDHKYLYDYFFVKSETSNIEVADDNNTEEACEFECDIRDKNGVVIKRHKYRFMNKVPLNDANYELKVNVLYFIEYDTKTKKERKWLWVTDIPINKGNAKLIMQGGRARWKIENETFNTLKNQGYNFEHNYGHGYKTLSNVFAGLMLLAFYVDQILEACNLEFKKLIEKYGSRSSCFEKIRGRFFCFMISSYERLYEFMINGPPVEFVL